LAKVGVVAEKNSM